MSDYCIKVLNVSKSFHIGTQDIQVLKDISFNVKNGDLLIIFGPSGCGKSTLLHTILGLEPPSSGTITLLDKNIYGLENEDERGEFRKKHIGMVYQQPNWIKSLNVVENVSFPLLLLGMGKERVQDKAMQSLKKVQMEDWALYTSTELSSGQQQRVSLARAMVTNPEIIIADEPTGNLDFEAGQDLMKLLISLNEEQNKTIVMVTHDLEYLKFANSAVRILDGEIARVYSNKERDKLLKQVKGKRGIKDKIEK